MLMQAIVLLFGLSVVSCVIVLIYFCKTRWLQKMPKFIQNQVIAIERKLIFNSILRALLEQYFSLCISTFYQVNTAKYDSFEDKINTLVSWFILLFILVFPSMTYRFQRTFMKLLPTQDFKMRYGALYTNVEYYKISGLSFTLVFLLRRLVFAFAIVYAYKHDVA